MKSIRRSFMYVFAIVCGLTFCGNAVLAAEMAEEGMAKGMVEGNLVISGNVEVNNDVTSKDMGGTKSTINKQDGRAELVFKAQADMGDLFVKGQGALSADQDEGAKGGDYFFTIGGSGWDITMGKKGGEGVYAGGQDIAYADAGGPKRYDVGYANSGVVGGFNLNFKPSDVMEFQLRIQHGTVDAGNTKSVYHRNTCTGGAPFILEDEEIIWNPEYSCTPDLKSLKHEESTGEMNNQLGFRPWMKLSIGGIGIVAAYESVSESAQESGRSVEKNKSGYGIKLTGDVGGINLGVNYTSGNDENDVTTNSTGGFVTVKMMAGSFGIGLHRDTMEDASEQNTFVSYVAPLPVEGSEVKVGYGLSTAGDNEVGLFRIRFNYAF